MIFVAPRKTTQDEGLMLCVNPDDWVDNCEKKIKRSLLQLCVTANLIFKSGIFMFLV